MKRILVVLAVALFLGIGQAAERKPFSQIRMEKLVGECQQSNAAPDSVNLFWVVPVEYWQVCAAQQSGTDAEGLQQVVRSLSDYVMIGAVRGDMHTFGAKFQPRDAVLRSFSASFCPEGGESVPLVYTDAAGTDAATVIGVIRPILGSMLGNMGQNFHLYLFKNRDAEGNRIVDPYQKGTFTIDVKPLGGDGAHTLTWEFPLDSLHIPRRCVTCEKDMHVSWNYCPWCGKKLPE